MPISPRLARALQQALGQEATEEFLAHFESNRADISELRHEMQIGFARIDGRFEQVRADVATELAKVRTEMAAGFAQIRTDVAERIERRFGDLMKWSFVFWVGAVTTIAVLLKTLR